MPLGVGVMPFHARAVILNSPPTYSQSRIVQCTSQAEMQPYRIDCGVTFRPSRTQMNDDSGCRIGRHREWRRDAPPPDRLGRRLLGGQRRAGAGAFSIGSIAATVGKPSWAVWIIHRLRLPAVVHLRRDRRAVPHKSGGASVYGAVAWVRYSKMLAPSVWCNWLAWSPVLAIGSGLAAGCILSILFAPDAAINTWQITLMDLGFIKGAAWRCG